MTAFLRQFTENAILRSKPPAHLLNISRTFGEFPQMWKQAIFLTDDHFLVYISNYVYNFPPISSTPTPVKVMEKIIHEKLISWFSARSLKVQQIHFSISSRPSTLVNLWTLYTSIYHRHLIRFAIESC